MTRRLLVLTILTGALLFSGVIADLPAPSAGAAMIPALHERASEDGPRFDVSLGEGMVQVLVRGCGTCPTTISIRIELPGFAAAFIAR